MKRNALFCCLLLALLCWVAPAAAANAADVAAAPAVSANPVAPAPAWLSGLTPAPLFLAGCCTFTLTDCWQFCLDQGGPNCIATYRCNTNCTYTCQCGSAQHPCL